MNKRKRVMHALKAQGYTGEESADSIAEFVDSSGLTFMLDGKELDEKAIRAIFKVTTDDSTGDIVNIEPMQGAEEKPEQPEGNDPGDEMKALRAEVAKLTSTVATIGKGRSPVPGKTTEGLSGKVRHGSATAKAYAAKIASRGIGGTHDRASFGDADQAAQFGAWTRLSVMRGRDYGQRSIDMDILGSKANTIGSFTAGGATVPEEFIPDLIRLVEDFGVARQNIPVTPMSRDTASVPRRTGGVTVYMPGEGNTITQSAPAFDQVQLTAQEWYTLTAASLSYLESTAIDFGDLIAKEIALAFAEKEDRVVFLGDGSATYFGNNGFIPKLKAIGGSGTPENAAGLYQASGDTWAEITIGDMMGLIGTLPMFTGAQPKFYCHNVFYWSVLARLMAQDLGSSAVSATGFDRSGRPSLQFLGYPVVISQVFTTESGTAELGATDARDTVPLLFGDLGMAGKMGQVTNGMSIDQSDQRYFDQGLVAFRGRERVAINIHDVGTTSVAGPVVGLVMAGA